MMMIDMGRFKKEAERKREGQLVVVVKGGTNASGNRGEPAIEIHGMT
jgi:hypothetical protein